MSVLDNLHFEVNDPLERAKLIKKTLEENEYIRKEYEKEQEIAKLKGEVRILEEWGIYLRSNELPRSEYLKKLTSKEQDALSSLFRDLWIDLTRSVGFGAIAVGTTTYSDDDWKYLDLLAALPNAKYVEYEIDFGEQKGPRKERPFSLDEIINNKGEDIDIKLVPIEGWGKEKQIYESVKRYASKRKVPMKQIEEYNIIGTQYETEPPLSILKPGEPVTVIRNKLIDTSEKHSLILYHKGCRPIHCYFENIEMHKKLDMERYAEYIFSVLIMNSNALEFQETIENGRKTGIYRHPAMIKFDNQIQKYFKERFK